MTFRSATPPLCRCCGKAIAKHSMTVQLTLERADYQKDRPPWSRYIVVEKFPSTKADCQKMTNEKVISVKRRQIMGGNFEPTGASYIAEFSTWDGESYRDQYFCNRTKCAVQYAYMVVQQSDLVSVAYNDAVKRQRKEKVA